MDTELDKVLYAGITSDKHPLYLFSNTALFDYYTNIESNVVRKFEMSEYLFFTDIDTLNAYQNKVEFPYINIVPDNDFKFSFELKIPNSMKIESENEDMIEINIKRYIISLINVGHIKFIEYLMTLINARISDNIIDIYNITSEEKEKLREYINVNATINPTHTFTLYTIDNESNDNLILSTEINDYHIAFKRQCLKELLVNKYNDYYSFVTDDKVYGLCDFCDSNVIVNMKTEEQMTLHDAFKINNMTHENLIKKHTILVEKFSYKHDSNIFKEMANFINGIKSNNTTICALNKSIELLKTSKFNRIGFHPIFKQNKMNANKLNYDTQELHILKVYIVFNNNKKFKNTDYKLETQSQGEDIQYNNDFGNSYRFNIISILLDYDNIKDSYAVRMGKVEYKKMYLFGIYEWLTQQLNKQINSRTHLTNVPFILKYTSIEKNGKTIESIPTRPEPFVFKIPNGKHPLLERNQWDNKLQKFVTDESYNYVINSNGTQYMLPSINHNEYLNSSADKYYYIRALPLCIFDTLEKIFKTNDTDKINELIRTLYLVVCIRYFKTNIFTNTTFHEDYKTILFDFIEKTSLKHMHNIDYILTRINSIDLNILNISSYAKHTCDIKMVGGFNFTNTFDYIISQVVDLINF